MITLIVLIVLNIALILPFILIKIPSIYYKYLFNYTIYYVENFLGYIIAIVAKIRTGKTTLLSGLSHILQIIIIKKNQKIMEDIRNILYYLNFNDVEYVILKSYEDGINDLNDIANIIISLFDLDPDHLYFDFLEFKPLKELIYDYVEAFYVVNIRQQYVYSRTYIYSHITHKANIKYNLEWTKIKDSYKNKNYAIYDNIVELIDEYSDEFGAGKNWEELKDESGAREYRRKYGHLHRERNYFIYTKQDSSDEVKKYRDITQSHLQIVDKVSVVGNYLVFNKFLNLLYNLPNKINNFRFNLLAIFKGYFSYDQRQSYIEYKLKGSRFGKKFQYKIYTIKRFLFTQSYCQFNIRHYRNEEHVGKENTENHLKYEPVKFIIPLRYCFGTFTRFEYNYIQKQLLENSELEFEDLIEATMFIDNDKKFFEEEMGAVYYEY